MPFTLHLIEVLNLLTFQVKINAKLLLQQSLLQVRFKQVRIGKAVAMNLVECDLRVIEVVKWPHAHPVNRAVMSHQLCHLHRTDIDKFLAQPFRIVRIGKGSGLHKVIHRTW